MSEMPWRRDPAGVARALSAWVEARIEPGAAVTQVSTPENTGFSSETVLFSVVGSDGEQRLAARLAPAADSMCPVFPSYDLAAQRRCMDLVRAHSDVPAPHVRWYEDDPAWLGSPFLVMDRIDGITPPDMPPYVFAGWLMDMAPPDRAVLAANAAGVLAGIHRITSDSFDLSFLAHPEYGATPLAQQLGYQRWYYDWAREGVAYPLIERGLRWLEANRSHDEVAVLNWGDSRIGNILWHGTDPVGVLDWEMATVGPPEVDLAWMIFLNRFFQDIAARYQMPGLPGFMEPSDMIAAYEQRASHRVREMEWFELFAALRMAIVTVRTSVREIAYGQMDKPADPDDVITYRALLGAMLDAVGAT
jgi:aminoglycoside phosphotransferase (APT) family kinase protein